MQTQLCKAYIFSYDVVLVVMFCLVESDWFSPLLSDLGAER
jgi:hypothetical protein